MTHGLSTRSTGTNGIPSRLMYPLSCMSTLRISVGLVALLVCPRVILAQDREPLPIAAVDLRGVPAGFGRDPVTAADLGVVPDALPARGFGGVVGAHLYVLRGKSMAIGVGGEAMFARGRAQAKDVTTGEPVGAPVEQRLSSISPQLSLNFGHREGWSYLSAGMGPLSFETFQGTAAPAERPPSKATINMGGGARWFFASHVAFAFDVRFYLTRPEERTESHPGRQRSRLLVMSAGLGFK